MLKIDISIVIVSYNVEALIFNCINSIYKNIPSHISFEIIVVDNASTDNSVELIHKTFPLVKLIVNTKNLGFPVANNQGFKITQGQYILMLNPDTEIIDDSIAELKSYLDKNGGVSLVGPKLLNSNYTLQYSAWRFPTIKYIIAEILYLNKWIGRKYYKEKNFDEPFEVDSISGAAMMFKKKLLDEVGMLNENLFWIEDIDFCYRIKKNGSAVHYIPQAKIIHYSGESAKKNYNISISNQTLNKIKFFKTHYTYRATYFILFVSIINVLCRLIIFLILSPFKSVFLKKSKAYFYTLFRIYELKLV